MHTNAVAGLPEIVKLMRTLSGNSCQVSVGELADVIQKDTVVLAKVIAAANTFGYNPNGAPISGISQAIHVIGYERIRALAVSLMLVEQTSRTQSSEEQRETAVLSLTAGCLAQTLAGQRLQVDPEQAFVCSALRSFGRMIMVTCMLDEYRNAQTLAVGRGSDDEAFCSVFGLTPLDLGFELLKAANLPEEILTALRELPPQALTVVDTRPNAQMLLLADFSAKLAELSLDANLPSDEFIVQMQELAHAYEKQLPGIASDIPALIESAGSQVDGYARAFRLKSLTGQNLNRLKQRRPALGAWKKGVETPKEALPRAIPGVPLPVRPGGTALPIAGGSLPSLPPELIHFVNAAKVAPPTASSSPAEWESEVARVEALIDKPGMTQGQVFGSVLATVRQIMDAPQSLCFLSTLNKNTLSLRYGEGGLFKALGGRAEIDVRERTLPAICLRRKENIMIHHAHDPKIAAYLPSWLKSDRSLGAYALLPLFDDKAVYGVMLVGWADTRQIVLSADQVRHIRSLLAKASDCHRRHSA